jgi:Flp pilus assembly protein TadD
MALKPDKAKIIAEELFSLTTTGGAAVAAGWAVPPVAIALGKSVVDCIFKIILANASQQPDAEIAIARIRQQQAASSIDIFRDSVIQATGLKPDFNDPLEELADAVAARQDHRDDERYKQALLNLFTAVMGAASKLDDIKNDTQSIRQGLVAMAEDVAAIKSEFVSRNELPSSAIAQAPGTAQSAHLEIRVEMLSAELRAQLDSQGRAKWDELNAALMEHTWDKSFKLSNALEQWLDVQGDKISPDLKAQLLVILADIAFVRDSGFPFELHNDTKEAWRILVKAESAVGPGPSDDNAQRFLRSRAKLTFSDGKREEAFDLLKSTTGPATVALQIAFLQEGERWAEASDFADSQSEPDKKWADEAIAAHIRAGRLDRATALLQWGKTQVRLVQQKCVLALVRTIYTAITTDGNRKTRFHLSEDSLGRMKELRSELTAAFETPLREGAKSGIEAEALDMAILIGHVLGDKQLCQQAAQHLTTWSTLSPELGRAVLRGDISPIKGLADRFINEQSGVFASQMIAAVLLIEVEEDAARGMQMLRQMLNASDEIARNEEICTAIMIGSQDCGESIATKALGEIERSLGMGHRIPTMLRAFLIAQEGNLLEAEAELAKVADETDYLWLQHSASLSVRKKDWLMAAKRSHSLAELTGSVEHYQNEAHAWHRAGDADAEIVALEHAHRLAPNEINIIHVLAAAYFRAGRYADAATKLGLLWRVEPHTQILALNYANCLALDGKLTDAIGALRDHIAGESSTRDIELVLTYARFLESNGNLQEALDTLLPHWDRFSGDHRYLMVVMHLGHATNREDEAGRALILLNKMFDAGTLPEGILQRFTLEDVKEMSRGHDEERKRINAQYLAGRLPWLIASKWASPSNHAVMAWRVRTHQLIQVDHPDSLAAYSIYSTNGFTAVDEGGHKVLDRLVAPTADTEIVVDISALITLHRLGLLTNLGNYFKKVLIPQSYKAIWIEEQRHIHHHQPSQIESRRAVVEAARTGKIISESDSEKINQCLLLDEYANALPPGRLVVRILQVAEWLAKAGKLSVNALESIKTRPHQPPLITDEEADAALRNQTIEATAFTLQTTFAYGLLHDLCDSLQVHVTSADLKQLEAELRGQSFSDEAGQWFRDLVEKLGAMPNVEFVVVDTNTDVKEFDQSIRYGIDAAVMAAQRGLPLMADDRYCQQGRLNVAGARTDSAFGTDSLLDRLADEHVITPQQHAEYWLQLVRWRYKFLLPQPTVLLIMASQFTAGLPGAQLREVVTYLHDCMRDIGLFGGHELVEPPISMAIRLYSAWLRVIADFVVDLWWDERFNEHQAAKLTKWIVAYFIPGRPRNLTGASWRLMSQANRQGLLGMILTAALVQKDAKKASRLVSRIRRSLKTTDDELSSVIESTTIAMTGPIDGAGRDVLRQVLIILMKIGYGHTRHFGLRLLPLAFAGGIIDSTDMVDTIPSEFMAAIANRDHSQRREPKVGPFAYVLRENTITAIFLPKMVGALSAGSRRAIAENLLPIDRCPMCRSTRNQFQGRLDELCESEPGKWVSAALTITSALVEDFELNVAGFSQSNESGNNDGLEASWTKIIRPTPEALLSIETDGWLLVNKKGESTSQLGLAIGAAASVSEFLAAYDRLAGHLVMAPPFDVGSQLRAAFERSDARNDIWPALRPWLEDKVRPWRRYHACEALLINFDSIPISDRGRFWEILVSVAEVSTRAKADSDEAQIWRFEADLAAHYLRCVDLGGYGLDALRPLTIAWWAARTITELLTKDTPESSLPQRLRFLDAEWIDRGTRLTSDAWFWISPKLYSPTRVATLHSRAPRAIALLIALGDFARDHPSINMPNNIADHLQDCFTSALLNSAAKPVSDESPIWMWDRSLIDATEAFVNWLPDEMRKSGVEQTIALVKKSHEANEVKGALKEIASASEEQSVFICSRVHLYCYEQSDAAEVLLEHLRDPTWRATCAIKIPLSGWELLAQGLLFLQARQADDWAIELPYVFLRLAEAASGVPERAGLFLTCMISASLVSDTVGAIKALGISEHWLALRDIATILFRRIEKVSRYCPPEISMRFRAVSAALEQYCAGSL